MESRARVKNIDPDILDALNGKQVKTTTQKSVAQTPATNGKEIDPDIQAALDGTLKKKRWWARCWKWLTAFRYYRIRIYITDTRIEDIYNEINSV